MSTTTNTRTARKSAASNGTKTAPKASPAPTQAAPSVTPADAPQSGGTVDTAPANGAKVSYTVPDWSAEVDQATYVAAVGEVYRAADKATKIAIRAAWSRFQSDALQDLNMGQLALVRDVNATLKTASARVTPTANPADAYVIHIAALNEAMDLAVVAFGEAHGEEARDAMTARLTELTDDEATARDTLAAKLAVVKSGTRRTGPARSVEDHLRSALNAAPAGTILTCSQVHNHRSDAYGPDESPSVGAVGAAHGREMDGIESVVNAAKVNGFRLA